MNETISNIIARRSVKGYLNKVVSMELVEEIVKAGMYAPSGMNRQSAVVVAVTDKAMRDKLSQLNLNIVKNFNMTTSSGLGDPFYGAPVVLVVLARKDVGTRVEDGALVMGNMMIAARSLGLGSCWIHRAKEMFETEEGMQLLHTWHLDDYQGIGNCIIGYPDPDKYRPQSARREGRTVWVR